MKLLSQLLIVIWLTFSSSAIWAWLSRIDRDNREERECAIRDLWFACYTQPEIAAAVGMSQPGIRGVLQEILENENSRFPIEPGEMSEVEDDGERLDALEAGVDLSPMPLWASARSPDPGRARRRPVRKTSELPQFSGAKGGRPKGQPDFVPPVC